MTANRAALRLAAYYAAIFSAVGIQIPFWPLWLKERGLSATEIGLLMAATYMTRIVANPLVGHWVDHRGDRKRPMLILALAGAACWLLFPPLHSFTAILAVTVLAVGLFAGLMPVGDSLAMMMVHRHRLDYGRVRLWGSLAFIVTATLVGRVLEDWSPAILPWLIAAGLLLTAASCTSLPDARIPPSDSKPPPVMPLLKSPAFLLFIGAMALNQAAHTVYYAFATIHWKAAGLSDTVIGLLWSEGVVAEILLFMVSNRVVAKLGPGGLLLAAALGGVLRWIVLGACTDLTWIAASQVLHAATFGCAHLGAMHFLPRAVPPALSVRAQGLYAALAIGLLPGLITPLSGGLYDSLGGGAFFAMAGLSAGSAVLAWMLGRRWHGGIVTGP